jgi:hypothetical protein
MLLAVIPACPDRGSEMVAQQQVQIMSTEMRKASSCRSEDMADLELMLAMAAPPAVQR